MIGVTEVSIGCYCDFTTLASQAAPKTLQSTFSQTEKTHDFASAEPLLTILDGSEITIHGNLDSAPAVKLRKLIGMNKCEIINQLRWIAGGKFGNVQPNARVVLQKQ